MEIQLIPEGLGPTWPRAHMGSNASIGVVAGPPLYLLGVLETALGLTGKFLDPAMRAAALVPAVRATDGFFARSAEVDPLGVAKTMLLWRDRLWLQGWRAEPITPRLADLAAVTVEVEPGIPDRLLVVLAALGERRAGIGRVVLIENRMSLPWLWREILTALEGQGTDVVLCPPEPVENAGDLRRLRLGQTPAGDRSVQLLRAAGPRIAADSVAAWLAAQDDWRGTLIIGGDAVLDHALRRHGLPTSGVSEAGDRPVTQILRLALAIGWGPTDPQRAFELLTLRGGPVPRALSRRLLKALHAWPAVDSDDWRDAMIEGLGSIEDDVRRERVERRVATIFAAQTGSDYPVALARRKAEAIARWCRSVSHVEADVPGPAYETAAGIAERFLALLAITSGDSLTAPELEQLVWPAEAAANAPSAWPEQAGVVAIDQPGALLGSASRVVWWSFSRERVPKPLLEIPLASAEVEALDRRGVHLWPPTEQAKLEAARWHRPLEQTTGSLLLVCPRLGEDGDALHPHPLWDEIATGASDDVLDSMIVDTPTSGTAVTLVARKRLAVVAPKRQWAITANLVRPRASSESPSSMGTLLGCSLAYALRYGAGLYPSDIGALPSNALLLGKLAHYVIGEALVASAGKDPKAVAQDAVDRFMRDGARLAAILFRPGADAERSIIRAVIERSTLVLAELIQESGLEVVGTERKAAGTIADRQFEGIADLVLGTREQERVDAVVDLKWGSAHAHRNTLESGVATQLASYARLFQRGTFTPEVAYFVLKEARLIARVASTWTHGDVDAADAADTWAAFQSSVADAFARLAAGDLQAPGNPDAEGAIVERSERVGPRIVLSPACHFCDFAAICGRAGREGT